MVGPPKVLLSNSLGIARKGNRDAKMREENLARAERLYDGNRKMYQECIENTEDEKKIHHSDVFKICYLRSGDKIPSNAMQCKKKKESVVIFHSPYNYTTRRYSHIVKE